MAKKAQGRQAEIVRAFAARLREVRRSRGMTQAALALEAGTGDLPAGLEWTDPEPVIHLHLYVEGPSSNLHVTARLRTTDGVEVPAVWVERYPLVTWRTDGRLLGLDSAGLVTEPKPGEYVLRVECPGMRPWERPMRWPARVPNVLMAHLEPE